ncbi:hypothetical protein V6N11_030160 [Hibiscus sabdariffa]|uniref:Uncharacterized protein n=1 Tax=Hibiscus sabdariffa TaxID=183260 RepID=A0ABR2PK17_9ROSI
MDPTSTCEDQFKEKQGVVSSLTKENDIFFQHYNFILDPTLTVRAHSSNLSPFLSSSASRVEQKTFIVRVQHEAKPSIFTTHKHCVFHGFSAKLSPTEALNLLTLPHVIAVIPEQVRYLQTTRSPLFLGLRTTDKAGLLKESDFGSDLVIGVIDTAAFDSAVADGVDVISLSVGGAVVPYYLDAIAIGAFGAVDKGVFVSASAGNGGPGGLTVTNVAPWVATVGAGTIDRDFPADVKLGNGKVVPGVGVYNGPSLSPGLMYPLVYAGSGGGDGYSSSLCLEGSLDPDFVKGKIVLCDRGINSRAAKGDVVKKAGGVGMILANGVFDGEGLVVDCHVLPATAVGASNAYEIRQYIDSASKSNSPATATIVFKGTRLGVRPAPVVASFSARGPNPETPEILKPDVIAPGLNILAAWTDKVGLAALLKAAHPEWSPAAIKRNADCKGAKRAGHIGNLNYPSFSVVFQQYGKHKMLSHFIRQVTNVGDPNSVYKVTITPPSGTLVMVEPQQLVFRRVGQKLNFLVRVEAMAVELAPGSTSMKSGSLVWSDGKHNVTSPIVVTMQQPL